MPYHYSAEIKDPSGQTIMIRDVHVHCRQEAVESAVSEITRFQQHFDQDGAWTDRQTLHCNGWTQFAGDAGTLFVQNLLHPEPPGTDDLKQSPAIE